MVQPRGWSFQLQQTMLSANNALFPEHVSAQRRCVGTIPESALEQSHHAAANH
jgi:hypothetical protein